MQTFLPYPDFERSARCLDTRRLGEQRIEANQILRTLEQLDGFQRRGWRDHPAIRMWQGYEDALRLYINVMMNEWTRRSFGIPWRSLQSREREWSRGWAIQLFMPRTA